MLAATHFSVFDVIMKKVYCLDAIFKVRDFYECLVYKYTQELNCTINKKFYTAQGRRGQENEDHILMLLIVHSCHQSVAKPAQQFSHLVECANKHNCVLTLSTSPNCWGRPRPDLKVKYLLFRLSFFDENTTIRSAALTLSTLCIFICI